MFAPSSTTYVKQFYNRTQEIGAGNQAGDWYTAGYFNTTSAINAISFQMDTANNIQNCVVQMYGVG